jgi:hypothetical protein
MDKYVFAPVIRRDKSEALRGGKLGHCSCVHDCPFSTQIAICVPVDDAIDCVMVGFINLTQTTSIHALNVVKSPDFDNLLWIKKSTVSLSSSEPALLKSISNIVVVIPKKQM